MDMKIKQDMAKAMQTFDLPKFHQLPDMGLYLEQVVKYINSCLKPLRCAEVTSSMVRNYVKMELVHNPVKKQYYASHLAYLIVITILKNAIPLEHIHTLFLRQVQTYTEEVAYDYFCLELKNILHFRFGLKDTIEDIGQTSSIEKEMLRSAVTAVSHIIFFNACLDYLPPASEPESNEA